MPQNPITQKGLVYSVAGSEAVEVRRDIEFSGADGAALLMDLYQPPGRPPRVPVVVMVEGYNDVGFERMLGCRFKDMASVSGWGRLLAASGIAAIAGTNKDPLPDMHALLRHLREHATELGLDAARLGLWASSGHGPAALSVAMSDPGVKCAALLYPYTMDLGSSTAVAEARQVFKFADAGEGKSIADLPAELPIFIARAGKDEMPGLNAALDRFAAAALAGNLALSLVNHPEGPHAFDLLDDRAMSRAIIRSTVVFLQTWLA